MKLIRPIQTSIMCCIVIIADSCVKSETEKWNQDETHVFHVNDSSDQTTLTVQPNSLPDGTAIYFGKLEDCFSEYDLKYQCCIDDYQLISSFIMISANCESFLTPNSLTIDYSHNFRFQYGAIYKQYYYHSDLQLFRIDQKNDINLDIIDMSNWSPIPFTFSDTSNVGLEGPGKITAQITDVNALYVVARKIN